MGAGVGWWFVSKGGVWEEKIKFEFTKSNLDKWRGKKEKKEKENQGNQCFDIVTTQGVFFQNVAIIYSLVSWKRKEGRKDGGKKKKRGKRKQDRLLS